jgi:hypothetical protein
MFLFSFFLPFLFFFSNFVFLISSLLLDPSQSRGGERTISSLKVSCCLFVSLAAILFFLLFTFFFFDK